MWDCSIAKTRIDCKNDHAIDIFGFHEFYCGFFRNF